MTQPNPLPHSTPEAQGIPSSAILDFVQAAESELDALHSFILVRHGHRVAQGGWTPYAPEHPHMLFSLSKSFTSTAVGLAVAEGRLSVDDPVLSFFAEDAPAKVSDNLAAMRVRHLLSMVTGHAEDTYTISLCLYETPFRPTITCRFEEDRLIYTFQANVGFGPLERPPLIGQMEQIP